MRTPAALDAMARWLVLTLAGVGLFALVPGSSFAAPGFSATRWVLALHPVQLLALLMMGLAWVLFVVHVAMLAGPWLRDGVSLALAVSALASVGASIAAFIWGSTEMLIGVVLITIGLHVALCLRIDRFGRLGTACALRAPRVAQPRKRRAVTAL